MEEKCENDVLLSSIVIIIPLPPRNGEHKFHKSIYPSVHHKYHYIKLDVDIKE